MRDDATNNAIQNRLLNKSSFIAPQRVSITKTNGKYRTTKAFRTRRHLNEK